MLNLFLIPKVGRIGHCSALIKVLPGYENIFAGHSRYYNYYTLHTCIYTYAKSSEASGTINYDISNVPNIVMTEIAFIKYYNNIICICQ